MNMVVILTLCTQDFHLPRKVLEMNSETWFPDRLISDRCVNSRFNILLNCKRERGGGGGREREREMSSVSTGEEIWETLGYIRLHGKFTSAQFYSARSRMSLDICAFPQFSLK